MVLTKAVISSFPNCLNKKTGVTKVNRAIILHNNSNKKPSKYFLMFYISPNNSIFIMYHEETEQVNKWNNVLRFTELF